MYLTVGPPFFVLPSETRRDGSRYLSRALCIFAALWAQAAQPSCGENNMSDKKELRENLLIVFLPGLSMLAMALISYFAFK